MSTTCPVTGFTEDDRSRALTAAVQGAQRDFIPAGMTIRPRTVTWPGTGQEFRFFKPNEAPGIYWPYQTDVEVTDATGSGTVLILIGNSGTQGGCDSLDKSTEELVEAITPIKIVEFAGCTDHTLTDGTLAAVSTYRGTEAGRGGASGYRKIVVDAVRPDGTRLHLVSDNHTSPPGYMTGYEHIRPTPPLGAEELLKIATIPGLTY